MKQQHNPQESRQAGSLYRPYSDCFDRFIFHPRSSRPKVVQHGLTLVELLIALAVTTLSMAVLLPFLAHARSEARRSNCAGNMHQCALAMNMYVEDYDNVYPTYRVDIHNAAHPDDLLFWHDRFCRALLPLTGQHSWVTLTRPYVTSGHAARAAKTEDNRDAYHCPDDSDQRVGTSSYEFKMQMAAGFALYDLRLPAATVMLWEQWAFHDGDRYSEYDRRAELNVAFGDGHAAWLRLGDTTNARYGKGPDLHWMATGAGIPPAFQGADVRL